MEKIGVTSVVDDLSARYFFFQLAQFVHTTQFPLILTQKVRREQLGQLDKSDGYHSDPPPLQSFPWHAAL